MENDLLEPMENVKASKVSSKNHVARKPLNEFSLINRNSKLSDIERTALLAKAEAVEQELMCSQRSQEITIENNDVDEIS